MSLESLTKRYKNSSQKKTNRVKKNRNPRLKTHKFRQDELIPAAAHYFVQRGYYGTSINEIALYLGCQKAAIKYITNKPDLFKAILGQSIHGLQTFQQELPDDHQPEQRIQQFATWLQTFLLESRDIALVSFLGDQHLMDWTLCWEVHHFRDRWVALLQKLLADHWINTESCQPAADISLIYLLGQLTRLKPLPKKMSSGAVNNQTHLEQHCRLICQTLGRYWRQETQTLLSLSTPSTKTKGK